ncbi:ABC transporter permease subunit [Nocardioides speluncae]|uniref:ABC transporter permease subunit n=1 Tax=Nocardioides speluncae TaxID=2670337 RepID=UPI000D6855A4|nr:ABC transporter permease subunit [Nocardioides speluncae]
MRLLTVELTRLRLRRAVLVLLGLAAVIAILMFAGTAWDSRPVSDEELAQAERQAAADANQPWVEESLRDCIENPSNWGLPGTASEADCEEAVVPRAEFYVSRQPLDIGEARTGIGVGLAGVVAALLMIASVTYAGHDWATGSMGNQLLFEPRRVRVWLAKAAAVALVAALASAAILAAFWLGIWALTESRDIAVSGDQWRKILALNGRGVLVGAGAALAGYALTMLFRSTVATISLMFGIAVAGNILIGLLPLDDSERWLTPTNIYAVLAGRYEYTFFPPCSGMDDSCDGIEKVITLTQGMLYFGVPLAIVAVLSLWLFHRRDVP